MRVVTDAVDDSDVPLTDALMALWFVRALPNASFLAFIETTKEGARLSLCWRYAAEAGDAASNKRGG